MAKIAIVSVGIAGRLHASCEMSRRLTAYGHQLVLASTDPRVGERLRGTALAFHQLSDGVPGSLRDRLEQNPKGAERWRLRKAATAARGQSALDGHGVDAFLKAERPDLLLVESELHNTILYLYSRFEPMVLLEYHLSVFRQPGLPPLDSHLTPNRRLAFVRAALAWRRTLLGRRARRLQERWRLGPWDARSVWERIAIAGGKTLRDIAVEDQWPILYYPHLPYLHLCGSELDFPGARTDDRRFIGPMIQRERVVSSDDGQLEACRRWLERRDRTRPLVVCATGSILTLPDFTQKIVRAAKDADFDLLVAAGPRAHPSMLGEPLPNVRVLRLIPQLDALAHAALFVCHAGISSIHESLLAGVPLLVCSGGRMDENGNAARIEYLGLGRRRDMLRDDADALRREIDDVMRGERIAEAVRAMRTTLQRYEAEQRLERAVEAHLAGRNRAE